MQPDVISDRYRVTRAIGRGGMGTVWLCRDEVLNRDVAVKQIGSLPGEDTQNAARAMREARVSAAMNHESAVSVFDVVDHEGGTWLVMEYLPSQTLAELVAAQGSLPPERVARIGAQVAAALASAHGLGIVHRDVKPGNVLVGPADTAKISDFGIARGHTDLSLTQTGMMTGTPGYFSPELARGDDPSFASDAWALGATLYAAVEGRTPFPTQANPLAILSMITREPPRPPEHAGPIAPVIAGLMDRDPARRWSMTRATAALREIADDTDRFAAATRPLTAGAGAGAGSSDGAAFGGDAPVMAGTGEGGSNSLDEGWTSTWSTEQAEPLTEDHRWDGWRRWAVAGAVVLLVAGLGLAAWSVLGPGGNDAARRDPAAGPSKPDPSAGGPTPDSRTPTTTPPETPAPTSPAQETTSSDGNASAASPAQAAGFVSSYYTLVPDDLDAGWAALSPDFQRSMGRSTYDGFWNGIDSVDVSHVRAVSPTAVDYTIVYHENGGGTSTENKQITLVRHGPSYLISGDGPQG